jgi:hypothetical protein
MSAYFLASIAPISSAHLEVLSDNGLPVLSFRDAAIPDAERNH